MPLYKFQEVQILKVYSTVIRLFLGLIKLGKIKQTNAGTHLA